MIYGNVTIIAVGRPKTDVGNKCNVCGKTVYVTEQLLADEKVIYSNGNHWALLINKMIDFPQSMFQMYSLQWPT